VHWGSVSTHATAAQASFVLQQIPTSLMRSIALSAERMRIAGAVRAIFSMGVARTRFQTATQMTDAARIVSIVLRQKTRKRDFLVLIA
jgi:hypothetical protein